MASPSGSGYCSWHEMKALDIGQPTTKVFKCKEDGCSNAATPDCEYCQSCQRWNAGLNLPELGNGGYIDGRLFEWELGEEPLSHSSKARARQDQKSETAEQKAEREKKMLEREKAYREAAAKGKPVSPLAKKLIELLEEE